MKASLTEKPHLQKKGLAANPLPERIQADPLLPGGELADVIEALAQCRPAWHLDTDSRLRTLYGGADLCVPRVPAYPCKDSEDGPQGRWAVEHASVIPGVRGRVAIWLETRDRMAWGALNQDDHGQLLRLRAAAARDIVGLGEEQLGEAFVYSDASQVRAKVRDGRKLLRALGAWPWCAFKDETGRPPRGWWESGHPFADAIFQWWRTDSPLALGHIAEPERPATVA